MRCKICGKRSEEVMCLRCETIHEDVISGLAREFDEQNAVLCTAAIEGDIE